MDNTEHRKTTTTFVTENLMSIFEIAMGFLSTFQSNPQDLPADIDKNIILEVLLKIVSRCMQFDFSGNTTDDGSDEIWVLQLPFSWEGLIRSERVSLLFYLYVCL